MHFIELYAFPKNVHSPSRWSADSLYFFQQKPDSNDKDFVKEAQIHCVVAFYKNL